MANDKLDYAAEIAESRLGMSSLKSHGYFAALRFAKFQILATLCVIDGK